MSATPWLAIGSRLLSSKLAFHAYAGRVAPSMDAFLTFTLALYMAHSKAVVIRAEIGNEPLNGSLVPMVGDRKEKQKIEMKVNAPATSTSAWNGVPQDEGTHVAEHRERDLMIAHLE
ncbi:hypothetical protein Syun_027946 [Stephania yunnanensis]|uniref:Uncharacterized protein n=1 Tax=Stephania yunnanensis TaxID=152371 RepID=A0AAP0EIY3_9MAGN